MITFTCPSCQGKCQVGGEFAGRKMRCPKCGARVRHHKDGSVEILSVGAPPGPSAAPAPEAKHESTAVLAAVADKFLAQGEEKQNIYITWGVVGFLAVVLLGVGVMIGSPVLAAAPPALALFAAFVWLYLRVQKREAALRTREDNKTEPITKP
jgi:hypothetical protein